MNKDFSKYQNVIDDFRGQVLQSDFEANFTARTKHIPKTERFLLKMELKRLASPCTRLVDLRGHVDGECRLFEADGKSHFLDDLAIKVYQENMAAYKSYTFGVYEAVKNTENNFRVIYQKEKFGVKDTGSTKSAQKVLEKTQYPANLYKFGPYFNRCEERMNFAIQITVTLQNEKVIDSTSSDISVNGCRFRFNNIEDIEVGQIVDVRFVGLEQEFQFDNQETFSYRVCNIQTTDSIQLVGTKRIYQNEDAKDGFKQFLTGFIQGNKRRYKINLDNSISALQSRSYEQYVLPKSNELPIFIRDSGSDELPRFALTCQNNQHTFEYWQDEVGHSTLDCLIPASRLKRLRKSQVLGKPLLVYSFVHKSGNKTFFYTADSVQLNTDLAFMHAFLGFAASKSSFAVTSLTTADVDESRAYAPLTLSESLTKKNQYLNLPISIDVKRELSSLPTLVIANDITTDDSIKRYQTMPYKDIDMAKLKMFGHKRRTSPLEMSGLGINYRNHRQEPRFHYKTPVVVESGSVKWVGVSKDFSASGLKIELQKSAPLSKGDIIYLTFPNLQKVTSAFELVRLPYEVMRTNKKKTTINIRVYVEQHQHTGRSFFKLLIEKNRDKLTSDEYELISPGLAKSLRNIYSAGSKIPALLVQTSGSRYKIEAITAGVEHGKLLPLMKQLSDRPKIYNLYPLLNHLKAMSMMTANLKGMHTKDQPITDTLYIAINPEIELVDRAVTTKMESELGSDKLKQMFIKRALKMGHFFCIRVKLSRADEPDMNFLNPELSYIASYAIHRGKQLEQDIWSVAGVIQIYDITDEALIKYRLPLDEPQ